MVRRNSDVNIDISIFSCKLNWCLIPPADNILDALVNWKKMFNIKYLDEINYKVVIV
jgi:hypothetical protein